MSALDQLHIIDIRSQLPRADWSIGTRDDAPTSATVHFNGPPVDPIRQTGKGLLAQLIADARYQMRPGGLGAKNGGDGLQYHITVDPITGQLYQTRDYDAELWHCRNVEGNAHSLSVQFPIGGAQDVTEVAWDSAKALFGALMLDFDLTRAMFKGHMEWSDTQCPGPNLMRRLRAWRSARVATLLDSYGGTAFIRGDIAAANVREGAGTRYPVALAGKAVMYPGDTLVYNGIATGESIGGDNRWLHRADDVGFVSATLVKGV